MLQTSHSFEDIDRNLLQGQGLSPATYKTYMVAVRKLYEFTGALNLLQVRAGHLEAFYDHSLTEVETNSAYNRMKALKCFFKGIEIQLPGFVSPFRDMEDRLIKKIGRTKKVKKQRALTAGDAKRLLRYLKGDESLLGKCNYAAIFTLLYTGLRASELCNLRWKGLSSEGFHFPIALSRIAYNRFSQGWTYCFDLFNPKFNTSWHKSVVFSGFRFLIPFCISN